MFSVLTETLETWNLFSDWLCYSLSIVGLFSKVTQVMTKCSKILMSPVIFYWTDRYQQHEIYLLLIIKRQTNADKAFLDVFQNKSSKVGLHPLWWTQESYLTIYYLYMYKMKQSNWLLCIAKNWDWSRKITPLKNLSWA